MIGYLLTSTLLSFLGWGLYRLLLRRVGSWWQRKRFLYLILANSLLLPLLAGPQVAPLFQPDPRVEPLRFGEPLTHASLKQYCRCETPNLNHRLRYRSNGYYHFLLAHKHWLSYGMSLATGGLLLFFGLQMLYLALLVRRSPRRMIRIGSQSLTLIEPVRSQGIGAFWLGRPYLIWQEPTPPLRPQERQAIMAHEWSHLRQRNTFEKMGLRLLQCWWFGNPVFYWLYRELEVISEFIADQAGSEALGGQKAYANLLLRLQSLRTPAGSAGLTGSTLRLRIQALMQPPVSRPHRIYGLALLTLVLQSALVGPLSVQISQTLADLHAYEAIYHQVPQAPEVIYCPDCETVCTPEGNEILISPTN